MEAQCHTAYYGSSSDDHKQKRKDKPTWYGRTGISTIKDHRPTTDEKTTTYAKHDRGRCLHTYSKFDKGIYTFGLLNMYIYNERQVIHI